jgi:hypothetical protein
LATRSGSTLTLTRAQDDTTAQSHSSGATIYPVFTADDADDANFLASRYTTKGDVVAFNGTDAARLAVGSNNTVLMADSAQSTGLKYASEATATLTTTGDVLYASAANTLARLGIGSSGQALVVSGGIPSWGNVASSGESDQVTLAVQVFS